MVEMFIKEVGVNQKDGHPVVLLKEKNGRRVMPIWVGTAEFKAIAMAMKEVMPPRPLTHDLVVAAFEALGGRITGVEICELASDTFYARLFVLTKDKEQVALDCRPSDGIALALRYRAPITVAPAVVEAAAYLDQEDVQELEDDAFKSFVANLKASDFGKFAQSQAALADSQEVQAEVIEPERSGEGGGGGESAEGEGGASSSNE